MSAEHESGLRAYAALFVLFLVLVAAGIFTVAMVWLVCYAIWDRSWAGTAPAPVRAKA